MRADRPKPRRQRRRVSSERKREHQPAERDAAEEERTEDGQEGADAIAARLLPEQREKDRRAEGIEKHQHDVIVQNAHAVSGRTFRFVAISKQSMTSNRFMRPAVSMNVEPYSKVEETTLPDTPMRWAMR